MLTGDKRGLTPVRTHKEPRSCDDRGSLRVRAAVRVARGVRAGANLPTSFQPCSGRRSLAQIVAPMPVK